ncbi:MAG: carbohydrate ABC transporter permease [Bacilli bacterium]|nr:carbohydrate ABC transporter permease [Bacilli bacterium]
MAELTLAERARRRNNAQRRWNKTKVWLFLALMILIGVVLIFPYFYMVMKSLMSEEEVIDPSFRVFPAVPQWDNYVKLFSENEYFRATLNSLFVIVFNILATCFSATLIAYSFAKLQWRGKNIMFALMMFTMMLPGIATQIPLYVMYAKMGWIDTLWPLTIPNLFGGGASYIFLLRQYMMGIPHDMEDAAKVDGASPWRIYWNIILPNCKPILIYIAVTIFMTNWGDYYGPLVFMTSSDAPVTLAYLIFKKATEADGATRFAAIRMAGGVFMTIFPALIFGIFQRQLTDGVLTAGKKG